MSAPLHSLDKKIERLKNRQALGNAPSIPSSRTFAMRAGTDLVSGVAVGTGIGYALDAWLNSLPWFTLVCTCLGLAAGIKLMIQTANKASHALEEEEKRNNAQEPK